MREVAIFKPAECQMQKINLDKLLRKAVCIDVQNHINARKDHDAPLVFSEALRLLKSHLHELTDEQIEEEIENRNKKLKQIKEAQVLDENEYYLNLELFVFRHLKRDILQNFPNSFSINR